MEYKKEDWVVGRMYRFIGGESTYTCGGFTVGKSYKMIEDVDWYFDDRNIDPDSLFIGDDGHESFADLRNFELVEQS